MLCVSNQKIPEQTAHNEYAHVYQQQSKTTPSILLHISCRIRMCTNREAWTQPVRLARSRYPSMPAANTLVSSQHSCEEQMQVHDAASACKEPTSIMMHRSCAEKLDEDSIMRRFLVALKGERCNQVLYLVAYTNCANQFLDWQRHLFGHQL